MIRAHFTSSGEMKSAISAAILKNEGAFQHKEFFGLCPSGNNWQIDAVNAKRKFQVFMILLLVQWYSRSGNGVCLTASAANCQSGS